MLLQRMSARAMMSRLSMLLLLLLVLESSDFFFGLNDIHPINSHVQKGEEEPVVRYWSMPKMMMLPL